MIKYFTETLTEAFNGGKMEQLNLQIALVFLIFFALIGFWVLRANISKMPLWPRKRGKASLLQHDFFTNYYSLKNTINLFATGNKELTEIFKIITSHKLEVVHFQTKEFIERENWRTINNQDLQHKIFHLLKSVISGYNKKILEDLQNKFGKNKGQKVYDYVMNAQGIGFNHWHSVNVKHIKHMVVSILRANVIKGSCHKMQIILYELLFGLHSGIIDAEKAFFLFNGELEAILKEPNN